MSLGFTDEHTPLIVRLVRAELNDHNFRALLLDPRSKGRGEGKGEAEIGVRNEDEALDTAPQGKPKKQRLG